MLNLTKSIFSLVFLFSIIVTGCFSSPSTGDKATLIIKTSGSRAINAPDGVNLIEVRVEAAGMAAVTAEITDLSGDLVVENISAGQNRLISIFAYDINSLRYTGSATADLNIGSNVVTVEMQNLLEMVADIYPGDASSNSYPSDFFLYDNMIYFSATDGTSGQELFVYNENTGSARMVEEINLSGAATPIGFAIFNSTLYFSANDGNGRELWSFDGQVVTQFDLTGDDIYASTPQYLTPWNGKLYFSALVDVELTGTELYSFNGSVPELVEDIRPDELSSYPEYITVYNDRLYFSATKTGGDVELWSFDGVSTSEINTSPVSSYPSELTVYNNRLFFSAASDGTTYELWSYDGSNALAETALGAGNPLENFCVYNDRLYFTMGDGIADGSDYLKAYNYADDSVEAIFDLSSITDQWSEVSDLVVLDGRLYFSAGTDANHDLYVYDSSLATDPVNSDYRLRNPKKISVGGPSNVNNLAVINNRLYFSADDGVHGVEMWTMNH